MVEKVIIIYVNKQTGKYDSFNVIRLREDLTLDRIKTHIEEYNNDSNKERKAILYDDPILADFVKDVYVSKKLNDFLEDLRDFTSSMDDISRDMRYSCENIQEFLQEEFKDV